MPTFSLSIYICNVYYNWTCIFNIWYIEIYILYIKYYWYTAVSVSTDREKYTYMSVSVWNLTGCWWEHVYKHLNGESIHHENHLFLHDNKANTRKQIRKEEWGWKCKVLTNHWNKRFFSQFADGLFPQINGNPIPYV